MSLIMWRTYGREWCFQTSDGKLANKMRERVKFRLSGRYMKQSKFKLWIYRVELRDTGEAKRRFKALTGRLPRYNRVETVYE